MKKRFIPLLALTMLASLFTLQGSNSSDLIETTLLEDQKGISLLDVRREATTEELTYSTSKMFVQHAEKDNNYYLRFATAVKGNLSKLTYTRVVEGYENNVKEVDTVYKSINAGGDNWYYNGTDITKTMPETLEYYWATYTIIVPKTSTVLTKDISLSLQVNDDAENLIQRTSKMLSANHDGTHTLGGSHATSCLEEYIVNDAKTEAIDDFAYDLTVQENWGSLNSGKNYIHGLCTDGTYIYGTMTTWASAERSVDIVRYNPITKEKLHNKGTGIKVIEDSAGITYYDGKIIIYDSAGKAMYCNTSEFSSSTAFRPYQEFTFKDLDVLHDAYYNEVTGQFLTRKNSSLRIYEADKETYKDVSLTNPAGLSMRFMTGSSDYIYVNYTKNGTYQHTVCVYDWSGNYVGKFVVPNNEELLGSGVDTPTSTNTTGLVFLDGTLYCSMIKFSQKETGEGAILYKLQAGAESTCSTCEDVINHSWSNYVNNENGTHSLTCTTHDGSTHTKTSKCTPTVYIEKTVVLRAGEKLTVDDLSFTKCVCGYSLDETKITLDDNLLVAGTSNVIGVKYDGVKFAYAHSFNVYNHTPLKEEPGFNQTGLITTETGDVVLPALNKTDYTYTEENGNAVFYNAEYNYTIIKKITDKFTIDGVTGNNVDFALGEKVPSLPAGATFTYSESENTFILNIAEGSEVALSSWNVSSLRIEGKGTVNFSTTLTSTNLNVKAGPTVNINSGSNHAMMVTDVLLEDGSVVNATAKGIDTIIALGQFKAYGTLNVTDGNNGKNKTGINLRAVNASLYLSMTSRVTISGYDYGVGSWGYSNNFLYRPSGAAWAVPDNGCLKEDNNCPYITVEGQKCYLLQVINGNYRWNVKEKNA